MKKRKILVVDDNVEVLEDITKALKSYNYEVKTAASIEKAKKYLNRSEIDGIILDGFIEHSRGIEFLKEIRMAHSTMKIPVLLLSEKREEIDLILGLEMGADDYMYKPYSKRELNSRLGAIFRRMDYSRSIYMAKDFEINIENHIILKHGEILDLTPTEFELLAVLSRYPQKVFTRSELLDILWSDEVAYTTRTIDVHISNLRNKFEDDPTKPKYIQTIRGYGYRFNNMEGLL